MVESAQEGLYLMYDTCLIVILCLLVISLLVYDAICSPMTVHSS